MKHPTIKDLNFPRAHSDGPWRAVTADLRYLTDAYRSKKHRHGQSQRANYLMNRQSLCLRLVINGATEYQADVDRIERKLAGIRADDLLGGAERTVALDRIGDDFERVEFAVYAVRDRTEWWPTVPDTIDFLADVFAMNEQHINETLNAVYNEPTFTRCGVFMATGESLAERMGFALPEGAWGGEPRLYVTAESQHNHRLNVTYAAWSFEPTLLDDDSEGNTR